MTYTPGAKQCPTTARGGPVSTTSTSPLTPEQRRALAVLRETLTAARDRSEPPAVRLGRLEHAARLVDTAFGEEGQ